MKKELLNLLQFTLIAVLVGFGFFGLALIRDFSTLSLWYEYAIVFINWLSTFIILSFIRFIFAYLIASNNSNNALQTSKKYLLKTEALKIVQYLILAILSVFAPFWTFMFTTVYTPGIIVNTMELWRGFQYVFLAWLIGFMILSLLGLGIVCIGNGHFKTSKLV